MAHHWLPWCYSMSEIDWEKHRKTWPYAVSRNKGKAALSTSAANAFTRCCEAYFVCPLFSILTHFDMLWYYIFIHFLCLQWISSWKFLTPEERMMCGPSDLLVLVSVCLESGAPGRAWQGGIQATAIKVLLDAGECTFWYILYGRKRWKDGGAIIFSILLYYVILNIYIWIL